MLFNVLEQLPKVICERCLTKLDLAFSIAKEFRQQEEKLRSLCWKGALVDQLVLLQESDENEVALYSDEVIQKLSTTNKKKQIEGKQETETEMHEFEVERLEEDHDEEQSELNYDMAGQKSRVLLEICPEENPDMIVPEGSVIIKAEIEQVEGSVPSDLKFENTPLPVTKIEVEEWIEEEAERSKKTGRKIISETLEFSCEDSVDSEDPIRYDEDDIFYESEEEEEDEEVEEQEQEVVRRKRIKKPKPPKRTIKSTPNADGKYECKDCGKIFGVQKTFLNHTRRHEHIKQGSYSCGICEKVCRIHW